MSTESAKAFIERVKNDEDFRKELEGLDSAEERMKFAKARGFDFTTDEIKGWQDTLTDDVLESVAAGSWCECGSCSEPI